MKLKITKKELFIDYIPTILVGIMIIAFAIRNGQTVIKTLPTLITLVVLSFTSRKSRAPKAEGIPYDKGSR